MGLLFTVMVFLGTRLGCKLFKRPGPCRPLCIYRECYTADGGMWVKPGLRNFLVQNNYFVKNSVCFSDFILCVRFLHLFHHHHLQNKSKNFFVTSIKIQRGWFITCFEVSGPKLMGFGLPKRTVRILGEYEPGSSNPCQIQMTIVIKPKPCQLINHMH